MTPVPVPPTAFVSYSHDSRDHEDRVLALSDRLRGDGIDVMLDQYIDAPAEGFPRWSDRQIRESQFVLCVCTPTYFRRVMGDEKPGVGKGARWEGHLVYQHLHDADTASKKFIPILLDGGKEADIPTPLRALKYYRPQTPEGYEELYRRLTGQHATPAPDLGPRRHLPPRPRKWTVPPAGVGGTAVTGGYLTAEQATILTMSAPDGTVLVVRADDGIHILAGGGPPVIPDNADPRTRALWLEALEGLAAMRLIVLDRTAGSAGYATVYRLTVAGFDAAKAAGGS